LPYWAKEAAGACGFTPLGKIEAKPFKQFFLTPSNMELTFEGNKYG
jgi:hypothetical protein